MNFASAISSGFRKFLVFDGRACRSEFWWWFVFNLTVQLAPFFIAGFISGAASGSQQGLSVLLLAPSLILFIALFTPSITMTARRLHDTNCSGWWMISVLLLIPLTVAIQVVSGSLLWGLIVEAMLVPLWCVLMLIWMCIDGTKGPNRFGKDPLDRTSVALPNLLSQGARDVADYERLERLRELQTKGVITEQEFEQQKSFLLRGNR